MFAVLLIASASGQETQRQYLSGHDKDDAVPWKFFCTAGSQSGRWTNLPVPSNWELYGFGTLNYFQDSTNALAEQGRYERAFKIPADWSGKRVFLVFDGAMTDTRAKINGQSAGPMHQGAFYRFKYEITSLLKFDGENLLEVTVDKYSANRSVNRAEREGDYWLFGGIFRPVYLEAVPAQFIQRVAVDAYADGTFIMDVFVDGTADAGTVEAQITDRDGKPVGTAFSDSLSAGKTTLKTRIVSPRQWTAETPNLYRVEVRLKQGNRVVHQIQQPFGFRTMEVRDGDGLYVNGQRVILKGANRHSFWPESGRCLSEAVHRLDIETIKDMNMNAVRMSHYPPDEQFLDLCDQLGLYVLDELGGWQKSYDTEVGRKLVEEMVIRDVNHPSILFWDNGNEGGWNRQLDGDYATWDPQQRRVLHPQEQFNGVNAAHYKNYNTAQKICATDVIYLPTEFMHGLYDGGAGAGMEDFWGMMSHGKAPGGGFVWSLLDEGVKRPDNGQVDVVGNAAPDGIVGPYRQREASFYTIKELWSPIVIAEQALPADFSGALTVENRYSFTDANQCKFTWQLRKFHLPGETAAGFTVTAEGKAEPPSISPGEKGALKLGLPSNWETSDALALRVDDPNGRELWTWVWPLRPADRFRTLVNAPAGNKATATETADAVEIKAGDLVVRINKQTGLLDGAQRGAQKFSLANGPRVVPGETAPANLEKKPDGPDYVVTATFTNDLKSVTWRLRGNGWLQCDYVYAAEGARDYYGVAFDYPEQLVKKKRWLGDGPYRVWKTRLRGVTFNVWENDYNNTITGWRDWVYPEFKGCFAGVRWLQLETAEGRLTAIVGGDDTYVQVLTPELPPANLQAQTRVSLPKAGLAFLQAIPPMGNKFQRAQETGPHGQPNMAAGQYSGSVSFYFGQLP
jgi:hypothetical protein